MGVGDRHRGDTVGNRLGGLPEFLLAFSLPHFGYFTAGQSTRAAFHLSPQGQNTIISALINIPPEADSETRIQVQVGCLHLIAIHMNRAVGK